MVAFRTKGEWRTKLFLFLAGTLFASAPSARAENVYAVPLSGNREWLGAIELPATITGRVSSATSYHSFSFQPVRNYYDSMTVAVRTNTGTNAAFNAVMYVGEGEEEVLLPNTLSFNGATPYTFVVAATAYEKGASYAIRIGLPDRIDVAFDGNGGTVSTNKMSYTLGGKYGRFPTASRIGYDFTGWGTAVTNGVMLSTNTQVCAGYTTLYAQWKEDPTYPVTPTNETPAVTNYYVSFNANGGTGTMSNQTFALDVPQALSSNVFTHGGYEFRGWATSAAGSVTYLDGAVVSNLTEAGSTFALYANWMISSASISSTNINGVTWHYTATNGQAVIQNVANGEYVAAVDTSAGGTLTIPEKIGTNRVVKIGERAFSGCSSVTNIVIPFGVETIGSYAFAGCTSLAPGITIPDSVESLGAYVFTNCPALKIVRYQGDCPDADEKLYAGAPASLISGVLRVRSGWMLEGGTSTSVSDDDDDDDDDDGETSSGSGTLAKWPEGSYARRVLWWVTQPVYSVIFWGVPGDYNSTVTQYYIPGRELESLPDEPKNADDRDGYTFLGWFTKPYGGTEVEEEMVVNRSFSVYAHWQKDDEPENLSDVEYEVRSKYVYDGYLLDGDGNMAGTIQLKTSKGKWSRANEETNVAVRATVKLLGEGLIRLKGSLGEDLSGTLASTKASDERELEVTLSGSGMGGTFEDYTVVGTRYIHGKKTYLDRTRALAADDTWKGFYVVVLKADSDESSLGNGYAGLSVQVMANGRGRVTGTMPDGTKVAYSGRMEVMDGNVCVLPAAIPLHRGKKGGFGFLVTFDESGVSVSAVSEWTNTDVPFISTLTAEGDGAAYASAIPSDAAFALEEGFELEGVDDSLLPSDVEVTVSGARWSTPKADKVKFSAEDGGYEVLTEYGNPSGLTLAASSAKGTFKGKFKVFAVTEAGKSKSYKATVAGAVLDGVGYGTATIRKIGSVPVTVKPE